MLRMEQGVAKIPERRMRGGDGHQRHGDSAIAGALAYYATKSDHQEYAYTPGVKVGGEYRPGQGAAESARPGEIDHDEPEDIRGGWMGQRLGLRKSGTW
jgi:hypothetical protein